MRSKLHKCWLDFLDFFFTQEKAKRDEIERIKYQKLIKIEKLESDNLNEINKRKSNKVLEIEHAKKTISESVKNGDLDSLKKSLDSLKKG